MSKIIIINHYGITPEFPGATKHYEISKYFSEYSDYDIEFWICGFNHHTGKNHDNLKGFKLQSKEKTENFHTVRIKSTPYRKSALARQINITVFDIITAIKILFSKDVELVLLSSPPVGIFNTWAIKLKHIKLLADIEDLWPMFLIDMGLKNKFAIKYMDYSMNELYKLADQIIAVSDGMVNFVKSKVSQKDKVTLVPLGVNLNKYENKEKKIELIKGNPWEDKLKIMYIGAHGRANDLGSVINTIERFNKLQDNYDEFAFVFIGDGDQKKQLINQTLQKHLSNVFFEDAIPSELVADYLLHADICLTNLKNIESFKLVRPNKLFQYMALSKPIICGIDGEARQIVEEANAGSYINFDGSVEAATRLADILNDSIKFEQLGENGNEYVHKYGDRAKIFKNLLDLVTNMIKE
ncbi:glycosyltransferase family 4 protein [Vaginisenegalia massiliensis]|uniref:glycosyltransferase family 4 protein n=1 Tax=Vaginisenegalia massiliensis TaxID=2058294 RepID=UPI000F528BAA|nr:glycosyltransferase family 4 protein [Vaginisenegalia massiliensis]